VASSANKDGKEVKQAVPFQYAQVESARGGSGSEAAVHSVVRWSVTPRNIDYFVILAELQNRYVLTASSFLLPLRFERFQVEQISMVVPVLVHPLRREVSTAFFPLECASPRSSTAERGSKCASPRSSIAERGS
jgi:hypothetical protein